MLLSPGCLTARSPLLLALVVGEKFDLDVFSLVILMVGMEVTPVKLLDMLRYVDGTLCMDERMLLSLLAKWWSSLCELDSCEPSMRMCGNFSSHSLHSTRMELCVEFCSYRMDSISLSWLLTLRDASRSKSWNMDRFLLKNIHNCFSSIKILYRLGSKHYYIVKSRNFYVFLQKRVFRLSTFKIKKVPS